MVLFLWCDFMFLCGCFCVFVVVWLCFRGRVLVFLCWCGCVLLLNLWWCGCGFEFCCEEWPHQVAKQGRELARLRTQKKKMEGKAHLVTKKNKQDSGYMERKDKIWTLIDGVDIFPKTHGIRLDVNVGG